MLSFKPWIPPLCKRNKIAPNANQISSSINVPASLSDLRGGAHHGKHLSLHRRARHFRRRLPNRPI